MKPKRVDPITGLLNFTKALALGNPYLEKQITTNLKDIVVDTSLPKDTNIWETGIKRLKVEGKWVIVEQYPSEDAAKIGHAKWVELLTENPNTSLKDIDQWSLGEEV